MRLLREGHKDPILIQVNKFFLDKNSDEFTEELRLEVLKFQQKLGLATDGIIGEHTWIKLMPFISVSNCSDEHSFRFNILRQDIRNVACWLDCEEAMLRAVIQTESSGKSFVAVDKPVIRFEAHIFYRLLKQRGYNVEQLQKKYPNIISRNLNYKLVKGGLGEYNRLMQAYEIDTDLAQMSTSWGCFQIMGFNYKLCGCRTVYEFVEKMKFSGFQQLMMFAYFIKGSEKLLQALRTRNFAQFAKFYNGTLYKMNLYDSTMERWYNHYKAEK